MGDGTAPSPAAEVSVDGLRSEMRGLHCVSARINRAADLESLLGEVLEALDQYFHFAHTSVQLYDEPRRRLITLASHGYGQSGIGAEVALGDGLIGMAALNRRVLRLSTLEADLRYGRAVRRETAADQRPLDAEIPLPGLPDAQSVLVIPLSIGDRLIGVLTADDRDPLRFGEWHEAYLEIVGNQIALGIDRIVDRGEDAREPVESVAPPVVPPHRPTATRKRRQSYYRNDDAVFLDGEYLIRNVPARILRKVLTEWASTGRTEFSNRELRLDDSLGLPPVKDNLESRLILLRHRLKEKCPDLQIVPTARGRFALRVGASIDMVER
jgi:adenylate cyclase